MLKILKEWVTDLAAVCDPYNALLGCRPTLGWAWSKLPHGAAVLLMGRAGSEEGINGSNQEDTNHCLPITV